LGFVQHTVGTIVATESHPKCNYSALNEIIALFAQISVENQKLVTNEQVASKNLLVGAIYASAAWLGCVFLAENGLSSSTTKKVSLISSTYCTQQFGTLAFALDPCCNSS
jgi:hypothetical protein